MKQPQVFPKNIVIIHPDFASFQIDVDLISKQTYSLTKEDGVINEL